MRSSRPGFFWPLLLLAAVSGCQDPEADPTLVTDLRILGVRLTPPEAVPGSLVSAEMLVAQPTSPGDPVSVSWGLCVPDLNEGLSSCSGEPTVPLGSGNPFAVPIAPDVLAPLDPELAAIGLDLLLVGRVDTASEHQEVLKRVRVSQNPAPNQNPVLAEVGIDGQTTAGVSLSAGSRVALTTQVTPESMEPYQNAEGPQTEEMRTSWFTTGGSLDRADSVADTAGRAETEWVVPEGETSLWMVVRDPRGGVTWETRTVTGTTP